MDIFTNIKFMITERRNAVKKLDISILEKKYLKGCRNIFLWGRAVMFLFFQKFALERGAAF